MAAHPHEYSSRSAAIRAARAACRKALGPAFEAYEGPDFVIHPSARPVWEPQGWRYELRGPAADAAGPSQGADPMSHVHRIWPSADAALRRIAETEGKRPSDVLSQLVLDYEAGLAFPEKPAPAAQPDPAEKPR